MQQPEAAKVVGRDLGLAVLHLPQLVGLALGFEPKELGMSQAHRLDRVGRGAAGGDARLSRREAAAPMTRRRSPTPRPRSPSSCSSASSTTPSSLYVNRPRSTPRPRARSSPSSRAQTASGGSRGPPARCPHPPLEPAGAERVGQAVDDDRGDDGERRRRRRSGFGRDRRVEDEEREQHRGDPLRPEPGDERLLRAREASRATKASAIATGRATSEREGDEERRAPARRRRSRWRRSARRRRRT